VYLKHRKALLQITRCCKSPKCVAKVLEKIEFLHKALSSGYKLTAPRRKNCLQKKRHTQPNQLLMHYTTRAWPATSDCDTKTKRANKNFVINN